MIDKESANARIHFFFAMMSSLGIYMISATTGFVFVALLLLRDAIAVPKIFWPGLSHQM